MIRFAVPLACLAPLVAGCASSLSAVPPGGAPLVTSEPAAAMLTVYDEPWHDDPDDLADYVTPVAVELYNGGPSEVRVAYADLALVDEAGGRLAAIDPFSEPLAEATGVRPLLAQAGSGALPLGPLYAARGHGGGGRGGGFHVAPSGGGRGVVVHAPPPSGARLPVHGAMPVGRAPGWGGYRPRCREGRACGAPGLVPWIGPWLVETGPWVIGWSAAAAYPRGPSEDVARLALPEGVLPPGARVDGYVFFRRLPDGAERATLTWAAHDAASGAPVADARVGLDVVRQ